MGDKAAEIYRRAREEGGDQTEEEIWAEIRELTADVDVTQEEIVEAVREDARQSLAEEQ
jgi:hypothetical protein